MDISVIIVNYNGADWLPLCLGSLQHQLRNIDNIQSEIIVIDNASTDNSVTLLEMQFPGVTIYRNDKNVGFAKANNLGVEVGTGNYILLLNTDTKFLDGLSNLLRFLDANPNVAAVGPLMYDQFDQPRTSWGYFPVFHRVLTTMLLLDRLPIFKRIFHPIVVRPHRLEYQLGTYQVDWASAACLLIRRSAWGHIGGFDPRYFMYGEDVEWSYRVSKTGYSIFFTSLAKIIHFGAGGNEKQDWKGTRPVVNAYQHYLYFFEKHGAKWQVPLVNLIILLGSFIRLGRGTIMYLVDRDIGQEIIGTYLEVIKLLSKNLVKVGRK